MNKTANYSLTIVIPVYNEEDNIKTFAGSSWCLSAGMSRACMCTFCE